MASSDLVNAYNTLLTMQDEHPTGAVVDMRGNSGGYIDQKLMTLLSAPQWQTIGKVGQPGQPTPEQRWRGKSAVVVDSFSYSDGSIFPATYQRAGLGPVVGQPLVVSGTALDRVTSALVPGLTFALPVVGFFFPDGTPLEGRTLKPDLPVAHDPNREQAGEDVSLRAAVEALGR